MVHQAQTRPMSQGLRYRDNPARVETGRWWWMCNQPAAPRRSAVPQGRLLASPPGGPIQLHIGRATFRRCSNNAKQLSATGAVASGIRPRPPLVHRRDRRQPRSLCALTIKGHDGIGLGRCREGHDTARSSRTTRHRCRANRRGIRVKNSEIRSIGRSRRGLNNRLRCGGHRRGCRRGRIGSRGLGFGISATGCHGQSRQYCAARENALHSLRPWLFYCSAHRGPRVGRRQGGLAFARCLDADGVASVFSRSQRRLRPWRICRRRCCSQGPGLPGAQHCALPRPGLHWPAPC